MRLFAEEDERVANPAPTINAVSKRLVSEYPLLGSWYTLVREPIPAAHSNKNGEQEV